MYCNVPWLFCLLLLSLNTFMFPLLAGASLLISALCCVPAGRWVWALWPSRWSSSLKTLSPSSTRASTTPRGCRTPRVERGNRFKSTYRYWSASHTCHDRVSSCSCDPEVVGWTVVPPDVFLFPWLRLCQQQSSFFSAHRLSSAYPDSIRCFSGYSFSSSVYPHSYRGNSLTRGTTDTDSYNGVFMDRVGVMEPAGVKACSWYYLIRSTPLYNHSPGWCLQMFCVTKSPNTLYMYNHRQLKNWAKLIISYWYCVELISDASTLINSGLVIVE